MDNETTSQNPDAPLKAFATFWVALGAFAVFGLLALIAYKMSGGSSDPYYAKQMERRGEIRAKVDAEQRAEMDSLKLDLAKAAEAFVGSAEVASQKPVPGTPAHAKMMEAQMAAAKAAEEQKKAEEEAKKLAENPSGAPGEEPKEAEAQKLELEPIANIMQFKVKELTAKAGVPIDLTFNNTDVLMHNVLVLKPGTKDKVGALADAMIADPQGMAKGYIPESDDIIAHTKLLMSTQSETIRFTLDTPGIYPFICTFPGHWRIMQGTLTVE